MAQSLTHVFKVADHVTGRGLEIDDITLVIQNRDRVAQETLGPVTGLGGAPAASFPNWLTVANVGTPTIPDYEYTVSYTLDEDTYVYRPDHVILQLNGLLTLLAGSYSMQEIAPFGAIATVTAPEGRQAYGTVAEADTYFSTTLEGEAWFTVDQNLKEKALITASDDIDRLPFDGYKSGLQVLTSITASPWRFRQFPRVFPNQTYFHATSLTDVNNEPPEDVKRSCFEQAMFRIQLHLAGGSPDARRRQQMSGVTAMGSGRASESFDHSRAQNHDMCPKAWDLIHPYVSYSVEMGYWD